MRDKILDIFLNSFIALENLRQISDLSRWRGTIHPIFSQGSLENNFAESVLEFASSLSEPRPSNHENRRQATQAP
jgi:hypothetical protein